MGSSGINAGTWGHFLRPKEGLHLCARDADVLAVIFSDEKPSVTVEKLMLTENERLSQVKEAAAIKLAEEGKLDEAELLLSEVIKEYGACTAYNNRAQVRQFLKRNEDALSDLDRAIM